MGTRPPPREIFFAQLAVVLKPGEYESVHFAYQASIHGHANQGRDDGTRYFDHPKAAAWIYINELGGRDKRTVIDLLLHDLSEDTHLLSPYRLSLNFGESVALDVHALTKLPKGKERTEQYLARIVERGFAAIVAKLCDRLHNLRTLSSRSEEKQQGQVAETREYHLPILVPALRELGAEAGVLADLIEHKIKEALAAV